MLIQNATICDHHTHQKADLRITQGKIQDIQPHLDAQDHEEVLDANGYTILPSLIDLHISPCDKSLSSKNLANLATAAHQGGVGSVALLPDCQPRIDSKESLDLINVTQSSTPLNLLPVAYGIKEDGSLADLSILKKMGCRAIFLPSHLNGNLMRRICEYASFLELPIICHCDDPVLRSNGVMNDCHLSSKLGLPAIPALAEVKEVAKMGEVAVFMQSHMLFSSLSSPRSFTLLKRCHEENPRIFGECSIHHLALTEELCDNYNTAAKILPPLKDDATRNALITALKNGEIYTLTSLHSASSHTQKNFAFEEAAFGVESLQDYFSLLYTFLIQPKHLNLSELIRYSSYHPAQFLGLNKGQIAIGKDADLIIVDTEAQKTIQNPDSPYHSQTLYGKVKYHLINGVCCYQGS